MPDFPMPVPQPGAFVVRVEQREVTLPNGQSFLVTHFAIRVGEVATAALQQMGQAARQVGQAASSYINNITAALTPNIRPISIASTAAHSGGSTHVGGAQHIGAQGKPPSTPHNEAVSPKGPSHAEPGHHDRRPSVAPESASGEEASKESAQAAPQESSAARPMPAPLPQVRGEMEKMLLSFVVLTIATMKFSSPKDPLAAAQKEIKEPVEVAPKPPADMMKIEPQVKQEPQNGTASQGGQQQAPNAPLPEKPQPVAKEPELNVAVVQTAVPTEPHASVPAVPPPVIQTPKQIEVPLKTTLEVPPTATVPEAVEPVQPIQKLEKLPGQPLPNSQPQIEEKRVMPMPAPMPVATPPQEKSSSIVPMAGPVLPAADQPAKAATIVRPLDAARVVERQANQVKPRVDAIASKERHEASSNPVVPNREDKKVEFRMPILPEFALSREGILKQQERSNGSRRLENEGHCLGDLLLMMMAAVVCGARELPEIYRFLEARRPFFTAWLGLKQGIPTLSTFWWLLNRLHPERFQELVKEALAGNNSFVYQIHLWDSDRGIIFGELTPQQKRPLALSQMVDRLDLSQAAVTIDARTLPADVARQVASQGADYILAIRGSHGAAFEAIQDHFEAGQEKREVFHEAIKDKERTEQREVTLSSDLGWVEQIVHLPGLQVAVRLLSDLFVDRRRTTETRYYLSSLNLKADAMASNIRLLSMVEQRVDWLLDCDFARSQEALKVEHAKSNRETLIRNSWRLLERDSTIAGSFETKRQKARQDNQYLRQLLSTQS
jgi:predicted transposase YbfD/YdcC